MNDPTHASVAQQMSNAALLNSQVACALVKMEAMRAFNRERERNGYSPGYDEGAFLSLIDEHGIGHHAALETLRMNL